MTLEFNVTQNKKRYGNYYTTALTCNRTNASYSYSIHSTFMYFSPPRICLNFIQLNLLCAAGIQMNQFTAQPFAAYKNSKNRRTSRYKCGNRKHKLFEMRSFGRKNVEDQILPISDNPINMLRTWSELEDGY